MFKMCLYIENKDAVLPVIMKLPLGLNTVSQEALYASDALWSCAVFSLELLDSIQGVFSTPLKGNRQQHAEGIQNNYQLVFPFFF